MERTWNWVWWSKRKKCKCILWLFAFPIRSKLEMQIITKCICISFSSITTLSFMFFPKIYIILFHPEKNVRALFTTSKSIRCHIGGASKHSNISHKMSNSFSSTHGTNSADFDSSIPLHQRSFKKSSSSQTSNEQLSLHKVDSSSSPIKEDMFNYYFPSEQQQITIYKGKEIEESKYDYQKVPSSPSQMKLKKNKIFMKDLNGNPNIQQPIKQKTSHKQQKVKSKQRQFQNETPIYCAECMEFERKKQLNEDENSSKVMSIKPQIFTVEKVPLDTNNIHEKRKIAISEESLSECSISDTACKLKRITIQLKWNWNVLRRKF